MSAVLGIDPGLDGALVVLDPGGRIIARTAMPTVKGPKKRHLDEDALYHFLFTHLPSYAWIENQQAMRKRGVRQGATSAFSTGDGFGLLRGLLVGLRIPYERVMPGEWQPEILLHSEGDTKHRSLITAEMLWPAESWLASPRCRTPHDGLTDAACIAEYGRRRVHGKALAA